MESLAKTFTPCSSVSIVNFEHVIAGWVNAKLNEIQNKLTSDNNTLVGIQVQL